MEALKQINQITNPEPNKPLPVFDPDNWDINQAEINLPGNGEKHIILTPALINQYLEGLEEVPELTRAVESLTEYYITDYFYYNNLLLVDSDIKIYLTSNFRRDRFQDSLILEPQPEYNILYNNLPADEYYYFNEVHKNCSGWSIEAETLDFLTWSILEEHATGPEFKTELQDPDILNLLKHQDPQHQELLRQTDYKELFNDIKTTYKKIITDYIKEAEEALETVYYEELYYPNREAAEIETIKHNKNKPLQEVE